MPKLGHCKTCRYLKEHPQCGLHQLIMKGMSYGDVAKKFKGKAGVGDTIRRHWKAQHMVSRQLMQAQASRDAKEGLDLMECQRKVWDDAQEAIDYALGRKAKPSKGELNLAVFGQCIAPQVKIIEVLAKVSPDSGKEIESDGMIEALKVTAKDDWKDTRPISLEATEPEAANGSELDSS